MGAPVRHRNQELNYLEILAMEKSCLPKSLWIFFLTADHVLIVVRYLLRKL